MPSTPLPTHWWLALALAAFACGSIPWGVLIAKSRGIDIRAHGSGNIGATNVGRVLGRKLGLLCFFLDMAKGAVPVAAAGWTAGTLGAVRLEPSQASAWLAVMVAPVLGHVFNPWLGLKGGKGVATSLGALLGVYPVLTVPGLLALGVWIVLAVRWRYVSLASIGAAAVLPIFIAGYLALKLAPPGSMLPEPAPFVRHAGPFLALGLSLAALVIVTHRANIRRLRAGTENRIGHRSRPSGQNPPRVVEDVPPNVQ